MTLLFDQNDRKDRVNRKKHGLGFDEAKEIFPKPGEVLTIPDQRKDYGEDRFINIGPIGDDLLVVVVHTNRAGMIRIISARKANRREEGGAMTISKRRLKEIKAISDEDIDYSDIPELGEDFFRQAEVWRPPEKPKSPRPFRLAIRDPRRR